MKQIKLLGLLLLYIACGGQVKQKKETTETKVENVRTPAKFEPNDSEVLLFVGQEMEAVGGLSEYNDGYLDHFDRPAGWTTYTNINPGLTSFGRTQEGLDGLFETHDWGDYHYNATLQLENSNYENMALAIGLQFVENEEKVADGTHDAYIDRLGNFLLSLGKRPVFLRIAYEFDGDPWNHYDKANTIKAYRRMVDRLRAKGVKNTAYVWQSCGFMSGSQEDLESWYPGDDYVDWCGYSFFNHWKKQQMIEFARKKGKPVFIAEATPTATDFVNDPAGNTGLTKEMRLGNPEQAQLAWEEWFVPFFKTIDDNPDIIKAVHYINCHWDSHPMWYENPTFKNIDARLHLSDSISKRWKKIISDKKYIKSSANLYNQMYKNFK